jgi:hypothetical protein
MGGYTNPGSVTFVADRNMAVMKVEFNPEVLGRSSVA